MKLFKQARKYGVKLVVGGTAAFASALALAQTAPSQTVWEQIFAAIGIEGIAVAVVTLMVGVIGIAMAFKGGDLGKRAVRKV